VAYISARMQGSNHLKAFSEEPCAALPPAQQTFPLGEQQGGEGEGKSGGGETLLRTPHPRPGLLPGAGKLNRRTHKSWTRFTSIQVLNDLVFRWKRQ